MTEKQISPVLKQVLEVGPTVAFFALFFSIKNRSFTLGGTEYSGFIVAAMVFIPVLLLATAVLWKLTGKVSRMQVFLAVTVLLLGGLTVWFNDSSFFKMKKTVLYGAGAAILGAGLLRGQSWLQSILGEALPMKPEGWMILTRRMVVVLAGLAIANEVIWRTQSDEVWVKFGFIGLPVILFVFMMVQIMALSRYVIVPEDQPKRPGHDAKD